MPAIDLEVFRNITSHPVLSKGVRELVYDGSLFRKDLHFEEYFNELKHLVGWVAYL